MVTYNTEDVVQYPLEQVLENFQQHYPRVGICFVEPTKTGSLNLGFIVETEQGKRFGKIHNPRKTDAQLLLQEEFNERLYLHGFPVPEIIKTRIGERHAITEIGKLSLYSYLDGQAYAYRDEELIGGATMQAKMHTVILRELLTYTKNGDFIDNPDLLFARARELIDKKINTEGALEGALQHLTSWNGFAQKLPKTVIHQDFHPWNSHYDIEGNVCGVFDFDFVGPGRTLYDLAVSLGYYGRSPGNQFVPSEASERTLRYLETYNRLRYLSREELESIPMLIAMRVVDNLTRDLRDKDASHVLTTSNLRNIALLRWAFDLKL